MSSYIIQSKEEKSKCDLVTDCKTSSLGAGGRTYGLGTQERWCRVAAWDQGALKIVKNQLRCFTTLNAPFPPHFTPLLTACVNR